MQTAVVQPLRWVPPADTLAITENGRHLILGSDLNAYSPGLSNVVLASLADEVLTVSRDDYAWRTIVNRHNDNLVIYRVPTSVCALVDHGHVLERESSGPVPGSVCFKRLVARDPTDGNLIVAQDEFVHSVGGKLHFGPGLLGLAPLGDIEGLAVRADGVFFTVNGSPTITCSDGTSIVPFDRTLSTPLRVEFMTIVLGLRQDVAYVVHRDMTYHAWLVRVDLLNGMCTVICPVQDDTRVCVVHRTQLYLRAKATIYFRGFNTEYSAAVERVTLPPEPDMAVSARMAALVLREI